MDMGEFEDSEEVHELFERALRSKHSLLTDLNSLSSEVAITTLELLAARTRRTANADDATAQTGALGGRIAAAKHQLLKSKRERCEHSDLRSLPLSSPLPSPLPSLLPYTRPPSSPLSLALPSLLCVL